MNHRIFTVFLALLVSLTLASGCATVKRKFTRKQKTQTIQPVVFSEAEDVKQFSNTYYYQMHFNYWKTWQSEILNYLGGNSKKVRRSFEESIGHLTEMRRYLVEPKGSELEPHIAEMKAIYEKVKAYGGRSDETSLRLGLERVQRRVGGDFTFESVKDSILPDSVDLSAPQ